jgi:hypothetical protein
MSTQETQFIGGAKLNKPKIRDFKYEKLFGIATGIPDNYIVGTTKIKNQELTDNCVGFASSTVSELQEKIELSPLYQFAKIKELEGNIGFGADIVSGPKSLVKFGSLEQTLCPFTIDKDRDFLANHENWPVDLDISALTHKKKSYFSVGNGFDTIKSAIWTNKSAIITGVMWQDVWIGNKTGMINTVGKGILGHAIAVIGFKKINNIDYLVIQNSYGETVGDKGLYYFSRDVVNKCFVWGKYILVDMLPQEAKVLIWSAQIKIIDKLIKALQSLIININAKYAGAIEYLGIDS